MATKVTAWPSETAPYRPDRVSGFFRRLRAELGLQAVTMHHLRHFMATQTIRAGTDIRTVSGRLGHAKTSTTLDIYAHFLAGGDEAAAEHMGQLMRPSA